MSRAVLPSLLFGAVAHVIASYNGFTAGTFNSLGNPILALQELTVNFQNGPLGSYYYPTTGGGLALINADTGSAPVRTPADAGLYHYTVVPGLLRVCGVPLNKLSRMYHVGLLPDSV